MKNIVLITTLFVMPLSLAGCDKAAEAPTSEVQADQISDMEMAADPKMGKGSGTVTAIDIAAGKITLDHGPIAELEWPAMKMGFAAKPELLIGVAVGDKVNFTMSLKGTNATVTALTKL